MSPIIIIVKNNNINNLSNNKANKIIQILIKSKKLAKTNNNLVKN